MDFSYTCLKIRQTIQVLLCFLVAKLYRPQKSCLQAAAESLGAVSDNFFSNFTSLNENQCNKIPYEVIPGKYLEVCISDTGVGMDHETLKHIFEPFYTKKPVGEGLGMGLSAAYGIVKNHNGIMPMS